MKVTVHRKAHFNAAHRLYRPDWSFEKNDAIFEVMPVCIRNFNSIVSFPIKSPVTQQYYTIRIIMFPNCRLL